MENSKLKALLQLTMALIACVIGFALVGFEVNTLAKLGGGTTLLIAGFAISNSMGTLRTNEVSTACGYVRDSVTRNMDDVDCKHCLRSKEMQHYHQLNRSLTDSQGCY